MGDFAMKHIERKIKRRANRKPVHWGWQVAMYACLGMLLWFCIDAACDWIEGLMVAQAQIMAYTLR